LPPAARLLLTGEETPPLAVQQMTVLRLPSAEIADGILAWSETRGLIAERVSPVLLAVSAEALPALRQKLGDIGIRTDG
jgi:hypothetical protein